MIIPGMVISVLTFPGIIVHELSHQFFCWLMKIPVYKVQYLKIDDEDTTAGYVIHERCDNPLINFIISVGPFFINTLLGVMILAPASIQATLGRSDTSGFLRVILLPLTFWLGISILMHAFPSTGDAKAMIDTIIKNDNVNIIVKILVAPFIGLIYLVTIGSIFWLDFFYALVLTLCLPGFISSFL